MPSLPDPPLISPGQLGTRVIQDESRASFDRRNKLLLMEGIRPDAVFIGDSLTNDWPVSECFGDLFRTVVNRGIGGDTASYVHLRLDADALQLKPQRVFFMIGTNDMAARFGYDTDAVILRDLEANYRKSFAMMKDRGARIFIGTVPPTSQSALRDVMFARKKVLIPAANRILSALARDYGFVLIDYFAAVADADGVLIQEYTTDGCHFTAQGYWRLNRAVRAAMERAEG